MAKPYKFLGSLSDYIVSLMAGTPWGINIKGKPNPPPPARDGRTAALVILRRYLSELTFYRPGKHGGPPIPFTVPEADMYIDWPENEESLRFPSIAMLSASPALYDAIGLTAYVDESTWNKFAPDTVLQWQNDYTETIALEVWASSKAELRAMIAGLEVALVPTEQWYGLRFKVPDYYDQLVCFALANRENPPEEMNADGRRRARLMLEMRMTTVALVNANRFKHSIETGVDIGCDGAAIDDVEVTVPWNQDP